MSRKSVLLLVDVQINMFEDPGVHDPDRLLGVLERLLARARAAGMPVFHVQNDGAPGAVDEPGSPGWEIHPAVAPEGPEVVLGKSSPDAFAGTELEGRLREIGATEVVVAGVQSELCIEATCRAAAARGFGVVLASDAHGTFETPERPAGETIAAVNAVLRPVAEVVPAEAVRLP